MSLAYLCPKILAKGDGEGGGAIKMVGKLKTIIPCVVIIAIQAVEGSKRHGWTTGELNMTITTQQ